MLSVAKENPSEQQTYLNIELVVHHQNNPQRAAPIRKSAQVKKFVKSLFRRKSLQKVKIYDANTDPTKSSDIDIASLPLVTHLQEKSVKLRK